MGSKILTNLYQLFDLTRIHADTESNSFFDGIWGKFFIKIELYDYCIIKYNFLVDSN